MAMRTGQKQNPTSEMLLVSLRWQTQSDMEVFPLPTVIDVLLGLPAIAGHDLHSLEPGSSAYEFSGHRVHSSCLQGVTRGKPGPVICQQANTRGLTIGGTDPSAADPVMELEKRPFPQGEQPGRSRPGA